jgi:hypothetical protein
VVLLAATPCLAESADAQSLWDASVDSARTAPGLVENYQQLLAAREARELAAKIDQLIAARWADTDVKPAAPADDATFLRRIYLDLAGRIPSVPEARAFLNDKRADRRARLVERLLAGTAYVRHFTNVWRALLLPESNPNSEFRNPVFDMWLRKQLAQNRGFDKMVRELLTTPIGDGRRGFNPYGGDNGPTPINFYYAKDMKPENLGASTARLFLGVKLDCAQCHDHPFAKWTRQQFWEYAAFFGGIEPEMYMGFIQNVREINDRREIGIPGPKIKIVQATFLDGSEPRWKFNVGSRQTLADWMTLPKNPFFAKAASNRMWAYFFGTGLVEPVDDLRPDNPPSHPELLDELAKQFAAHDFDFKFLIRAITASRTYQLSSEASHDSQDDPRLFARASLRGLTPEQIFDSLAQATGYRDPRRNRRFFFEQESLRQQFLSQFASQDKRTEFQTSILQSLMLMNGKFIAEVTSPKRSATLAAVVDAPFLDTNQKIEALFLAALSRPPRAEEMQRFLDYVDKGGAKGDKKAALGDIFWVLLNSPDFILNH